MNSSRIKKVLILVAILAVPGFLYYLLQDKGKNRYKPLPIYGPKQVASTFHSVRGKQIPDTIYHLVDDFVFTNQNGDTTTLKTWKGKVVVLNLFYTQVNSDGAKMSMKAMQGFNEMYQNNHMVHLASISVDSKDDLKAISNFAKSQNAGAKKWDFLIGDTVTLNKVIKRSLLLDAVDNSTQNDRKFLYSNKIVLLDSQHRIRGFYEASNQEALSKLDDEIKVLIAEELRNIKDGR